MLRPTTPAPMTMVFGRCDGITSDALMTDSLHRACPARFSGSDLSRPPPPNPPPLAGEGWVGACRTAPQPHSNFKPSPAAMQGFSAGGRSAPRQARPPGDHPRGLLTFSTD